MSAFCLYMTVDNSYKDTYINTWKEISLIESHRTGIPVSIILGQAILESNYGNSELAKRAKNHFGIKCKKEWLGGAFQKKDDDLNKKGQLIKSCFRAYDLDIDSFIDHSHFLMGRVCYNSILSNKKRDYHAWARSLQNCGYATDKKYAQKLIKIIESHQLWKWDQ